LLDWYNIALTNIVDTNVEMVSEIDDARFESLVADDDQRLLAQAIAQLKSARNRDIMGALLIEHKDKKQVCILLGLIGAQFDRVLNRAKTRLLELMIPF